MQSPPGWGSPAVAQEPVPPPAYAGREPEIQYIEAIKFAFSTPDAWNNILIGFVFTVIPVVGPIALLGWYSTILQRLVKRDPNPIPKLDFGDLSPYLTRGFPTFAAAMIFAMPLSMVLSFGIGGGMAFANIIAKATRDPTAVFVVMGIGALATIVLMPIMSLLGGAISTRAELTEDLGQTFKLKGILDYLGKVWGITLVSYFVMSILTAGIVIVGLLVCFVGVYAATIIARLGMLHLRWQLYEIYLARGGEPVTVKVHTERLPSEIRRS